MKRLKKVSTIVFTSLFIVAIGYAGSDSADIIIRIQVVPQSTVEVSERGFDWETIPGDSSNMLVRTTTVEDQTYQEVIPLE